MRGRRLVGVACAAAGLVLAGLGARQGRILLWLGAALAVACAWALFRKAAVVAGRKHSVTFDDQAVVRRMPDGRVESVRWDQLAEVEILTTDDGPWGEDVYWLLTAEDGKTGCAVPSESEGMPALLIRLQGLPGFDNGAVIKAMGSTSNARFVAWRRVVAVSQ